jgi:integrase
MERAGLSASTRKVTHAVLRRALAAATREGLLARNPAEFAEIPVGTGPRAQSWTASELARFLDRVADDRVAALWRLAATTGARRGELLAVTWRVLDLDSARLRVEQQIVPTRGGASFGPPKSSRSRRTIALDPETVAMLRTHRDAQVLERDFAGDAYVDQDLAFCDELGAPYHPQWLSEWFSRHRKAVGLTGSLHILRHTAITLMLTVASRCTWLPPASATPRRRCSRPTPTCCPSPTRSPQSAWQPRSRREDRLAPVSPWTRPSPRGRRTRAR